MWDFIWEMVVSVCKFISNQANMDLLLQEMSEYLVE